MVKTLYAGIAIEAPFFKGRKLINLLEGLQEIDPFLHSVIVQHVSSIKVGNDPTERKQDEIVLHHTSLKAHPAWITSWIVRFALEQEAAHSLDTIKMIKVDNISNLVKKDKPELTLDELRFVQDCADRIP